MLQAEQQFRRVIGYTDLSKLVIAIERRHLTLKSPVNRERIEDTKSAAALVTV